MSAKAIGAILQSVAKTAARGKGVNDKIALSLVIVLFSWSGLGQDCLAQHPAVNNINNVARDVAPDAPQLPLVPQRALKSIPRKFEVYQYDSSPLNGRAPLLLIHGLQGEFHPFFRWKQLADYLSQNKAIQQQYKIYLARYNSQSSLKDITSGFNLALRNLPRRDRLTIVTISMPCLIVRNAMKDPAVNQSITRVIALGGFFRGSPLFCSDWMLQTIKKRHLSPLSRLDRWLVYKAYFHLHKNLLLDYGWDNVDGQMPAVRHTGARADLEAKSHSAQQALSSLDTTQNASDHKFVVYAGYVHNQFTPRPQGDMQRLLFTPFNFFKTTLPAHLGREHQALLFINQLVAAAIPGTADKSTILYPLNDGISPISSSLLLSDDFAAHADLSKKEDMDQIRTHSSAKTARVFDNVDHLTFIEAKRPFGSSTDVTDVLSPTEQARPIFDWILKDLMD